MSVPRSEHETDLVENVRNGRFASEQCKEVSEAIRSAPEPLDLVARHVRPR